MEMFMSNAQFPVGICIVALSAVIIMTLFKLSPSPNFREELRKQREHLMAFDEHPTKKRERPIKRKDKKQDRKEKAIESQVVPAQLPATGNHVDFCNEEQIKIIEQDSPIEIVATPKPSDSGEIRPILVEKKEDIVNGAKLVRSKASNSFSETKPKDEVELRGHTAKVAQSPQIEKEAVKREPEGGDARPESSGIETLGQVGAGHSQSDVAVTNKPSKRNEKKASASNRAASAQNGVATGKFETKDLLRLVEQIEKDELPSDMGEELIQVLVDAFLNYHNESKSWKSTRRDPMQVLRDELKDKEVTVGQLEQQLESVQKRSEENHRESLALKVKIRNLEALHSRSEAVYRAELQQASAETEKQKTLLAQKLSNAHTFNDQLQQKVAFLENSLRDTYSALSRAEEERKHERDLANEAASLREINEQLKNKIFQEQKRFADESDARAREWKLSLEQRDEQLMTTNELLESSLRKVRSIESDAVKSQSVTEELEQSKSEMDKLLKTLTAVERENTQLKEQIIGMGKTKESEEQLSREVAATKSHLNRIRESLSSAGVLPDAKLSALDTVCSVIQNLCDELVDLRSHKESATHLQNNRNEADAELEDVVHKLEAENSHYSQVLAQTEDMLQNLQEVVEREETKWAEERRQLDSERTSMRNDLNRLEESVKTLNLQLRSVSVEKEVAKRQLERVKSDMANLQMKPANGGESNPAACNGNGVKAAVHNRKR